MGFLSSEKLGYVFGGFIAGVLVTVLAANILEKSSNRDSNAPADPKVRVRYNGWHLPEFELECEATQWECKELARSYCDKRTLNAHLSLSSQSGERLQFTCTSGSGDQVLPPLRQATNSDAASSSDL